MKTILTYLLCFTIICNTNAQEISKVIKINHIRLYKDFTIRGYTTAGAYTHFDDMNKNAVLQINVEDEDKSRIEEIVNRAKIKKHHQQKFGTHNLFFEVQYADRSTPNRVIFAGVATRYSFFGKPKGEIVIITDLTCRKEYQITDKGDLEWLSNFHERMRLE